MEQEKIENAKIEEEVILEVHPYYKKVRFTKNVRMTDAGEEIIQSYCWTAYDEKGRCSFPIYGNVNKVTNFKTLVGAKRNFLRTYPKQNNGGLFFSSQS